MNTCKQCGREFLYDATHGYAHDLCGAFCDGVHSQQARLRALSKGLKAVRNLIRESRGVIGLHLNGDEAPWDSLLEGGRYEEWLLDFSVAEDLIR